MKEIREISQIDDKHQGSGDINGDPNPSLL